MISTMARWAATATMREPEQRMVWKHCREDYANYYSNHPMMARTVGSKEGSSRNYKCRCHSMRERQVPWGTQSGVKMLSMLREGGMVKNWEALAFVLEKRHSSLFALFDTDCLSC